jgi:hypothetical protein
VAGRSRRQLKLLKMLSTVAFWGLKKFLRPYVDNLDDTALEVSKNEMCKP